MQPEQPKNQQPQQPQPVPQNPEQPSNNQLHNQPEQLQQPQESIYPPQQNYPYPPQSQKNKRTKIIVISIISFVVLAAIAGLVIWLLLSQKKDESKSANTNNTSESASSSNSDAENTEGTKEEKSVGNEYTAKSGLASLTLPNGWTVDKEEKASDDTDFTVFKTAANTDNTETNVDENAGMLDSIKIQPVVTLNTKKLTSTEKASFEKAMQNSEAQAKDAGYTILSKKKVSSGTIYRAEIPAQEGSEALQSLTLAGIKGDVGISFSCTAQASDWKLIESDCMKAAESIRFK